MSNNEMSAGVIVPVYNAAKHLNRCLLSLARQTYKPLKIYLVDDASIDGSIAICEEFCNRYDSFKLIKSNVNRGVSSTRNLGLQNVDTDVVFFLDSDDYIDTDFIEHYVNVLISDGCDMVIGAFRAEDEEQNLLYSTAKNTATDFVFDDSYDFGAYYSHKAVWGVAYRREAITNLSFDTDLSIGEDLLFITRAMLNSRKIRFDGTYCGYHYTDYQSSSYHKADARKMLSNVTAYKRVISLLTSKNLPLATKSAQKRLVYKYEELFDRLKQSNAASSEFKCLYNDYKAITPFVFKNVKSFKFWIKWLSFYKLAHKYK